MTPEQIKLELKSIVEKLAHPEPAPGAGAMTIRRDSIAPFSKLLQEIKTDEDKAAFCDAMHTMHLDVSVKVEKIDGTILHTSYYYLVMALYLSERDLREIFECIKMPLRTRLQGSKNGALSAAYAEFLAENVFINDQARDNLTKQLAQIKSEAPAKKEESAKEEKSEDGFDQKEFERIMRGAYSLSRGKELAAQMNLKRKDDSTGEECYSALRKLLANCKDEKSKQAFFNALHRDFIINPDANEDDKQHLMPYHILLSSFTEELIREVLTALQSQYQAYIQNPQAGWVHVIECPIQENYDRHLRDNKIFVGKKEDVDARKAEILQIVFPKNKKQLGDVSALKDKETEHAKPTSPIDNTLQGQKEEPKKPAHPIRDHFLRNRYRYRLLIGAAMAIFVALVLFVPGLNSIVLSGVLLTAAKWVITGSVLHGLAGAGVAVGAGLVAAFLDYIVAGALWLVGETVKYFVSPIAYVVNEIGAWLWRMVGFLGRDFSKIFSILGKPIIAIVFGLPALLLTSLAIVSEYVRWSAWVIKEKNTEIKKQTYEPLTFMNIVEKCRGENLFVGSAAVMSVYIEDTAIILNMIAGGGVITDTNKSNPAPLPEPESSSPSPH